MTTNDELAARRKAKSGPESPDKVRWMLWLSSDTLARLAAESQRTSTPRAQIVRDVVDARVALTNDQVSAYIDEAAYRGVSMQDLFTEVLAAGAPTPRRPQPEAVAAA